MNLKDIMIPYIILNERPEHNVFSNLPLLSKCNFPAVLPFLPLTLDHLYMPVVQYARSFSGNRYQLADFRFIFDDYPVKTYLDLMGDIDFAVVFMLSKNAENLMSALNEFNKPLLYIDLGEDKLNFKNLSVNPDTVIRELPQLARQFDTFIFNDIFNAAKDSIKTMLREIENLGLRKNAAIYDEKESFPTFGPSITNNLRTLTYPRKIWNGHSVPSYNVDQTSDRSELIVDSIESLDLDHLYLVDLISEGWGKRYYQYQPIILSLPYINKRARNKIVASRKAPKGFDAGMYNRGLRCEQDPSTFSLTIEVHQQVELESMTQSFALGAEYNHLRIKGTSATGSFHALLSDSPIYRGPSTGVSVDGPLDFFDPENYQNTTNFRKQKLKIIELGKAISERFNKRFIDYLASRNGQVVSISDLPLELMTVNEVPLFFKFDHTRILESSHGSQMGLFSSAARGYNYIVSPNSLKKILVVCCVPQDKNIASVFHALKEHSEKIKGLEEVIWTTTNSIEELSALVKQHRPEILVLDTHGKHREAALDSLIQIGDKFVDGSQIVESGIVAPVIILSACSTVPLKGYVNPIAQAFFENGAISVLSTMLPVNILKSSTVYFRLLSNLPNAINGGFHQNWSSYVSHILRTSIFEEFFLYAKKLTGELIDEKKCIQIRSEWQAETLYFEKRDQCFKKLPEVITQIFDPKHSEKLMAELGSANIVPEAYFYSLLGRSDLIRFSFALMDGP